MSKGDSGHFKGSSGTRSQLIQELKDNKIKAISDLTEKELRQAHNLQKMYKAGAFNG